MKHTWLVMAPLALLCSACIPVAKMTRYEPAMENATVRTDACIGWKTLEYRDGDIVLLASIERWPHVRHDYPALRLRIEMPADGKLELVASSIEVLSPHLQSIVHLPVAELAAKDGSLRRFGLDASLAAIPEGDVRIQLPDLLVNGQRRHIPPMQFKHTRQALTLLPLNC